MSSRLMCLVAMLAVCGCIDESEDARHSVSPGERVPAFDVVDDSGRRWTADSLLGHVSLLAFFDTQCPDCQHELPVLQTVYDAHRVADDLSLLCISRAQLADEIAPFWAAHGLTMPYSAQADRTVYDAFTDEGIPFVVIARPDRVIYSTYTWLAMPDSAQLSADVNAAGGM